MNKTIFLFLFSLNLFAQNWIWQNPNPLGKGLRDIFILNEEVAFAVGESGAFIKTNNSGQNWININTGISSDFNSVWFLNANTGFVAGNNGKLFLTVDGGLSFTQILSQPEHDFYKIFFIDNQNGFIVGSNGAFYKTINGGTSWSKINTLGNWSAASVYFLDSNNGFLIGELGEIKKTTNGGQSWQTLNSSTNNILSDITFINSQVGWICGLNGTVLKTSDSGNSWTKRTLPGNVWLKSISFSDEQNGIIVGTPGIIYRTSDGGNNWFSDSSSYNYNLLSAKMIQNKKGWVVGSAGIIIKTSDAGLNWEFQSGGFRNNLNGMKFFDSQNGWIIGDKGLILKTTNGGDEWIQLPALLEKNLNDIGFDNNLGWIVGDEATLITTTDYGISWQIDSTLRKKTNVKINSAKINYISKRLVGDAGEYYEYRSIDQFGNKDWVSENFGSLRNINSIATTWDGRIGSIGGDAGLIYFFRRVYLSTAFYDFSIPAHYNIKDIFYSTIKIGWAVGSYGVVLRTNNSAKFNIIAHLDVNQLNSVYFLDTLKGFVAGTAGSLFKTTDGGQTWTKIFTGIKNPIKKIYFADENNGWLIGENGMILKTTNGGGLGTPVGILQNNNTIVEDFILQQNYPNPFNPVTTISWNSSVSGWNTLKVFDILGREIATLVNEYKQAGSYSAQFKIDEQFASGIYLYQLKIGNVIQSKKMVYLR